MVRRFGEGGPGSREVPRLALASDWPTADNRLTSLTNYIVDELLTLLSMRGHRDIAKQIGPEMWRAEITRLHWITPQDINNAWNVFTRFEDKSWSFTDCTSHAIMRQLGIVEALALDEHFQQFGFVTVKP